ncbi:MAG: hypothetical protein ACRES6_04750 [Steroidobacteraceae bacterium]
MLAGVPRWAARHPHVAASLLRWRNACRQSSARILLIILLAPAAACALAGIPQTGLVLAWLGRNVVVTFVVASCLFGLSAIRRRERSAAEAANSWLAALPAASPVFLRVLWGTLARLVLAFSFVVLVFLLGRLGAPAARGLALAIVGAAVFGSLAGWRLWRTADNGPPGFHSAIVRRVRARWATDPSLLPLSYWPAAQGRIFSRPKVLSRVAFMALIGLPLGTPGQVALAIAAACIALFSMASLSIAATRVAFEAARWLAPTSLRPGRFMAALVWRPILTQALFAAVMVFLACAIDLPKALRLGVPLAAAFLVASLAVAAGACGWACRRVGLGAASRGAYPHGQLAA